jgi:hypothetical protein
MPHYKDITGQKFGKWTAVKHVSSDKNKNAMWTCVDESGEKRDISANYLRVCLRKSLRVGKKRGPVKYVLRSVCGRGHEHENTGKSQRYEIGGGCTVCGRLRSQIANEKRKDKKEDTRKHSTANQSF